jgi:putative transcriptional regulator
MAGALNSLKGQLLVATPALGDPNFDKTVIFVLEHNAEGALGLVLNRPTDTDFVDPLPDWYGFAAYPPVVFVGGPVAHQSAIGLARVARVAASDAGEPVDGFVPVLGTIGTVDLSMRPEDLRPEVEEVRVFAGYAGWSDDQLEAEIDAGAWFVVSARPDDALSTNPEGLWSQVLRRQPGRLALFANFPPDPALN